MDKGTAAKAKGDTKIRISLPFTQRDKQYVRVPERKDKRMPG